MKIFITGASGFVGGAVARHFAQQGHDVVAMSRSEKSDAKIKEMGAQPVRGSLGSVSPEALKGVDIIVHAAAYVEEWGSYDDFYQPNVIGTKQLVEVAKQAGVAQFIFIGTEALLFTGDDLVNVDETYPYPENPPFYYSKTKQLAEKAVLSANQSGFKTVSVRPRLVWGPGDQSVLPAVKRLFEAGSFTWIGGGQYRTSTTHIDNLVHGVALSIKHGKGGNAYFILDEEVHTMREFLTRYLATAGVELKGNSIPKGVVRTLAAVVEGVWRLFSIKKQPPITRFTANVMSAHCVLNDDKARRELGYRPIVSSEEGLARL